MIRSKFIRPLGLLASAAAITTPLAMVSATTAQAGTPPAPKDSGHDSLDEHTTLETCTADLGGVKVAERSLVGFFHKVGTNDGSVNKAKKGSKFELEYRLENLTDNCTEGTVEFVSISVDEVSCDDPWTVITPSIDAVRSIEFEEKEGHFEAELQFPKVKNSCYVVTADALDTEPLRAIFRTK